MKSNREKRDNENMKMIINIWLKFNGLEAMKKFTKEELS